MGRTPLAPLFSAVSLFVVLILLPSAAGSPQPFGGSAYEQYAFDATEFPDEAEYDYIVVGGGTAGCPLAATLSTMFRVLLLERGGLPSEFPNLIATQDSFLSALIDPAAASTHDHPAQPFISADGIPNARGRVLGGSSAINAGFYSRAHPEFYKSSPVTWNMALVNESYDWVERAVTFQPQLKAWQTAVRDALLEANVTPFNGFTLEHVEGTKIGATTFDSTGRRHSAADLLDYSRSDNIKIALRATVVRVLLNSIPPGGSIPNSRRRRADQQVAIGVLYRDRSGRHHHALLREGGEVILSAGAIGSPQLLLLSGIGPRPYLSSLAIPVAVHSHWVGQLMADNPRNGISFLPPNPHFDHSLIQVVGITPPSGPFLEAASTVVTIRSPALPTPPFMPLRPSIPISLNVATLIEKTAGPKSTGTLTLATLDPRDNPIVRFNYFSAPEDLAACVAGVSKIGDVLDGRAMEEFKMPIGWGQNTREFRFIGATLPANRSDQAAMEDFCRRTVTTIWHYHGGCVAGKVVDGEYKVVGVSALRVVDSSTFTVSPGTNPQATVMMMGRYVGRRIVAQRRWSMSHRSRRSSTASKSSSRRRSSRSPNVDDGL